MKHSKITMPNPFFRVVAASPKVSVADTDANASEIISILKEVAPHKPDLVVFPELSVTGYTCADLFHSSTLLDGAIKALKRIVDECPAGIPLVFVGVPIARSGALYNCAVGISRGKIHGIVPKKSIPNYNEFYERRWFTPAADIREFVDRLSATMSARLIFRVGSVKVGAEICEDLWTPAPPSSKLAMQGAEIIANLSASDDIVGKYTYLKNLICQQSARCISAYVYASAGYGESSTDLVFDGKCIIAENGVVLAEADRFRRGNKFVIADIDIDALRHDRRLTTTFADSASTIAADNAVEIVHVGEPATRSVDLYDIMRYVDPHPFVPSDPATLAERCEEILHIQESGLAKRLEATGCKSLVIGISGGLDSTLALLVAVRAFDSLGLPRSGITGITMPGFGTTGRTRSNALELMKHLGVTILEIPISDAVNLHFRDIGHNPAVTDITFENAQARERTQILMDMANRLGGMVLGTGDLSELALGWATYNGDHMSMYGVNAGVPKTLVRHLVRYVADAMPQSPGRNALLDIIDTPISPELIPAAPDGDIAQRTEDVVGPYELHDFFLYRFVRFGEGPRRIWLLASKAFDGVYDSPTILKWLRTFVRRFFSQQFKRSCIPDGPKVGSVTLSPRGDWRMPSDASAATWLNEIDDIESAD